MLLISGNLFLRVFKSINEVLMVRASSFAFCAHANRARLPFSVSASLRHAINHISWFGENSGAPGLR